MMGDWIRGTRGMRAEVKGVYIGLLLHQYDEGFIPSDLDTLSLIEPEVGKVWVMLKNKFKEISPGKLQNEKLEEVRAFWQKQRINGKKGGRPKVRKPKSNPNDNPNTNPNNNLYIDSDYEDESLINYKEWTEILLRSNDQHFEQMVMAERWKPIDFKVFEYWAKDHLDLLHRYPKMRPPDQNAFRRSVIKHLRENKDKNINGNIGNNQKNSGGTSTKQFSGKYEERL
jgi:hypothetical protein